MKNKLSIGFITYNDLTAKYLPYFLPSLKAQSFSDFDILVADNSDGEDNKNKSYIKNNYRDIDFEWMGENIGFAKAYNKLIEKARENGAKYFMAINPDVILEETAVLKLVEAIENEDKLGSVCPKILSWDFANNKKTKTIDSLGLIMSKVLRFVDLGQGEEDNGQFVNEDIIGPSGAAGLFRMSALEKIKDEFGYFDSKMFMYKEDCDLAYRLFMGGLRSKCVDTAIIYHDRTASKKKGFFDGRKSKSKNIKKWSFLNQQIIFRKHWSRQSLSAKSSIIYYQFKVLFYIVIFERYLFKYFFTCHSGASSLERSEKMKTRESRV